MAMAVSRPPNDWLKFKNPARMQAFARVLCNAVGAEQNYPM